MKMKYLTNLPSLATLLVLLVAEIPSLAHNNNPTERPTAGDDLTMPTEQVVSSAPNLERTDGVYRIKSVADYDAFRQIVATGNPYANAVLENNIKVSSAIGTGDIQFHYRGTFDGQGHTIEMVNLTHNTDSLPWGLFQYTEPGCVIKNLKVTGTIASSKAKYIGTLIGCSRGTRIENCMCTDTINYQGNGCVGGLVGINYGESFFENCAFTGKINAETASRCYGFVGKNVQMVSLKSNYVAATFNAGTDTKKGQFMEVSKEKSQTILNNYYYAGEDAPATDNFPDGIKEISKDDISHGKVCYDLNVNGRNGVVWYLDNNIPSPFKGNGNVMGVKKDDNVETCTECEHSYEGHICQNCGAIEDNCVVDPLQVRQDLANDLVTIGYLKFKLNKNLPNNKKTAEFRGLKSDVEKNEVTAVHIPDYITVDGVKYTIDYIHEYIFSNSKVEYCYIPATVDHIWNKAFNDCRHLRYLHIADGETKMKMEANTDDTTFGMGAGPLFEDCPLDTLYIGRDLMWDPATGRDAPFEGQILKKLFFGPRVTCVGNTNKEDNPRELYNNEPFDGGEVKELYFMGDADCIWQGRELLIACTKGMSNATKHYINRTFDEYRANELDLMGYIQMSDFLGNSIYDQCETIIYGPYCKKIAKNSFSRFKTAIAEPRSVDFTNAFNLEEIGDQAFDGCNIAYFKGTFENTKLFKIGKQAFNNCDNLTKVIIPSTVMEIDEEAFSAIDGIAVTFVHNSISLKIRKKAFFSDGDKIASIYYGRYLEYTDGCPFNADKELGTVVIAPEIYDLPANLFTDIPKLGALTFAHNSRTLKLNAEFGKIFSFSDGITSMYINREIREHDDNETVSSWGDNVKRSLHDLTCGTECVNDNFSGFKALQTVIFGENVGKVSKDAFKGCTELKTLFAMGNIDIQDNAFEGCISLEQVFLMGNDLKLRKNAFTDCNKIYQIIAGLTEDPKEDDSDVSAFTQDVYANAIFTCAGDTKNKKVDFTREPWRSFQKHESESVLASDDYEYGYSDDEGEYEHARLNHHFDNGKYEMVYLPFDMDSYSFGADAEIYKLDNYACETGEDEDANYSEHIDDGSRYCVINILFKKQDLDEKKKLNSGIYIVNTAHNIESLESHPNLFEGPTIKVMNNERVYGMGLRNKSITVVNNNGKVNNDYIFNYQEGVIKYYDQDDIPSGIIMYPSSTTDKECVFNLVDSVDNVIISSATDLEFSTLLEGYCSFYDADHTYIAPDWCEVYVVTQNNSEDPLALKKIEDGIINKGQAVLIKSSTELTEDFTEYITYTTKQSTTSLYNDNMLRGVNVDTKANELDENHDFVYVLGCDSNMQNTGFYKLSGDALLPAHKAYIPPYLVNTTDLPEKCLLVFDDNNETGITHAATNAEADNTIYDLMGRSLKSAGFKGIYIINGNKVIIN